MSRHHSSTKVEVGDSDRVPLSRRPMRIARGARAVLRFPLPGFGMMLFSLGILLTNPLAAGPTHSFGAVTLTEISPRVITPNDDGYNDAAFFRFDDTLIGMPIETSVLDVHGARVSSLGLALDDTALRWNGKDDAGRTLPAGIYIYSIQIGKNQATGTIVIAN